MKDREEITTEVLDLMGTTIRTAGWVICILALFQPYALPWLRKGVTGVGK